MKQRPCERQCIEHLLAFVKRVDLNRSERYCTAAVIPGQLSRGRGEVVARASQNSNAPGLGAPGRKRFGSPLLNDEADLASLTLTVRCAELRGCGRHDAGGRMTPEYLRVPRDCVRM